MDRCVSPLWLRFFLQEVKIANLRTVLRAIRQGPPAPDASTPLDLRLQKSLKACAQGGTCLKCLQLHCSDKAPTCRCHPRPPWLKIFDAVESYAF